MRRIIALLVVVSLLTSATAGTASAAIEWEIDKDHDLTTQSKINEFEKNGTASTKLVAPQMRVTVAEEHEDVGLSGVHSDAQNTYLRFQYNETGATTVRMYIPDEYFGPREHLQMEAVNDPNVTADFEPSERYNYTVAVVRFEGQADAVFKLSKEAGLVFGYMQDYRGRINNSTGIQLPNVLSSPDWHHEQLNNTNTTYAIRKPKGEDVMIQYDADPSQSGTTWLPVPDCSNDKGVGVCKFEKSGDDAHIYIMATSTDPPDVRYAYGSNPVTKTKASIRDITVGIPNRINDFVDNITGLFGGGDGSES